YCIYYRLTGRTKTIRLNPKKVIDISHLNNILFIDKDATTITCELNVSMKTLVNTTLKENLVPLVVTELSSLTVSGAFTGIARECSSFKFRPFHITCSKIEIIIGDDKI
ncbi:hypothetical protein BJ875DRAFT_341365, partial [Amylocarpus encephaloides]